MGSLVQVRKSSTLSQAGKCTFLIFEQDHFKPDFNCMFPHSFQFVYKTEKQSDRFSMVVMVGDTNNRRKTIATAKQALFYIGAFHTSVVSTF